MSAKRHTDEFKIEAIRRVMEKGHKVPEVADQLGVTTYSLYSWIRLLGPIWLPLTARDAPAYTCQ